MPSLHFLPLKIAPPGRGGGEDRLGLRLRQGGFAWDHEGSVSVSGTPRSSSDASDSDVGVSC